jgi:ADP-heptose:LPS heptosyltransferase
MRDNRLLSPDDIERIGIFRPLHLGDLLCAIPGIRAVRAAFPKAQITLIGLPWAQSFIERYACIDRLLPFPGFPGLPQSAPQLDALPEFFSAAQACRFDLVLQLQDDGALANPLCAAMGARRLAGFYPTGGWCPDAESFIPWAERGAEVTRWLRLLQFLEIPTRGEHVELPVLAEERARYVELAASHGLRRGRYVCVSPGARLASRRWPVERFAAVCDWLAEQGFDVVITGTGQERDVVEQVIASMQAPAIDLSGSTDIGMFAALVADARLLICNDTGASQVAAAARTPSVVICAGTDPERQAPLDTEHHHLLHHAVICRPCVHAQCPFDHPCATAVTVAAVLQRARLLLQKEILNHTNAEHSAADIGVRGARSPRRVSWTHAT